MRSPPDIPLDSPTILAPMAGISDLAFRTVMRRRGSAVSITELVSADGLIRGGDKTRSLCAYLPEERPFGIQLFGSDATIVGQAAEIAQEMKADFIDLNFGCPVKKVVKKGAGAAATRDPEALAEYLKTVQSHLDIPLTIKIRTGWDATSINALEVAQVAQEAGCTWIAIHGRTRAQGYKGYADWDLISEVAQAVDIPVIGNGDILEGPEAQARLDQSGCVGVMVGRGALRNPWVFLEHQAFAKKLPPPTAWSFVELLDEQRQLLVEHFSDRHLVLQMKKFAMWYSNGFPGSREFRSLVFKRNDLDGVWDEARRFFESVAHLSVHTKDRQPFLKGGHG